MPKNVNARDIFDHLKDDPAFVHCYLHNADKKLYTLDVLKVCPETLQLELQAPQGRVAAVCTKTDWDFTFRDRSGVYQAEIIAIEEFEGHLRFTLGEDLKFLARRKSIRFAVGSRNPITVSFMHMGEPCEGHLVDLSIDGMGVIVEEDHPFKVDDTVYDVSFDLRSTSLLMAELHVTHVAIVEDGEDLHPRIGFCFRELKEEEAQAVKDAFNQWYLSQKPSLSTRVDA